MPRKSPKPRKPGQNPLSATKNRRAVRPEPGGVRQGRPVSNLQRRARIDARPPRFPGRLGGR